VGGLEYLVRAPARPGMPPGRQPSYEPFIATQGASFGFQIVLGLGGQGAPNVRLLRPAAEGSRKVPCRQPPCESSPAGHEPKESRSPGWHPIPEARQEVLTPGRRRAEGQGLKLYF
jgi:hypothetical protein